jgi:hypothetical protein
MKFLFAGLLTLTLAAPASASWWPSFSERAVYLVVGDSLSVRITPTWSGLVDYGDGVHWTFRTDNPYIAAGFVRFDNSLPQDLRITGVAPGITNVRQEYSNGGTSETAWVRVDVGCGIEPPALPATASLRSEIDQPVALTIVSPIANRTTFHWYRGRIGDTTQPIDAAGPDYRFTPKTPGPHDIWVEARTTCTSSHVQFHIDVPAAKRRATRH